MNSQQILDRAKSKIFLDKNAAFLGSVLCSLTFSWNENIPTARVCGTNLEINEQWFLSLNDNEQMFVLLHEVWHIARLHALRLKDRDKKIFNVACDIAINNDLKRSGYFMPECGIYDLSFDKSLSEEEIYDILVQNSDNSPPPTPLSGDIDTDTQPEQIQSIVNSVMQARESCKQFGSVPDSVKSFLDKFTKPKVNWKAMLRKYLTDTMDFDYSWQKPNRRYQDIYIPGKVEDDGKLIHLAFFLDVSGSITENQIKQFITEIKYIQEEMTPQKLTVIQFDTRISKTNIYNEGETVNEFEVEGGGGTDLKDVKKWIDDNHPTAAVIFSDLYCEPMKKPNVPIIWIIIDSNVRPEYGTIIPISCED